MYVQFAYVKLHIYFLQVVEYYKKSLLSHIHIVFLPLVILNLLVLSNYPYSCINYATTALVTVEVVGLLVAFFCSYLIVNLHQKFVMIIYSNLLIN